MMSRTKLDRIAMGLGLAAGPLVLVIGFGFAAKAVGLQDIGLLDGDPKPWQDVPFAVICFCAGLSASWFARRERIRRDEEQRQRPSREIRARVQQIVREARRDGDGGTPP